MRYLFRKGLEVNSRSRYVHLSWARFELDEGNVDNARELFRRGHSLNPQDAPLLQVLLLAQCTCLIHTPCMCSTQWGVLTRQGGSCWRRPASCPP